MKADIYDLTLDELTVWLDAHGHPGYRAKQLFGWLHDRVATGFDKMTNLPAVLREELVNAFRVGPYEPLAESEGDDSKKLLLRLSDGEMVECVRLTTAEGAASLCVSCQVGCAIRCDFCASGTKGFVRNLTAGEIVGQTITLRSKFGPARNIVFMGMGEPMLNLGGVLKSLEILTDKNGWGIAPRRITIATSGIAKAIRRYAHVGPETELAVSLNAPTDGLRRKLMPGTRDSLAEVLSACDTFTDVHGGQPVTYSYVLLAGVNDRPEHASQLIGLLRERRHHVNLIAYNAVAGKSWKSPPYQHIEAFVRRLHEGGLNVTRRRGKGQSIDAACGQLRARPGLSREGR